MPGDTPVFLPTADHTRSSCARASSSAAWRRLKTKMSELGTVEVEGSASWNSQLAANFDEPATRCTTSPVTSATTMISPVMMA